MTPIEMQGSESIHKLIDDQRSAFANLDCHVPSIQAAVELMLTALRSGGKVLWCGNGGSAAEAQHMAAELMGRFNMSRPAIASLALTTDTSFLTGFSNDIAFESVFSRQIEGLGKFGDVLVAYSTSGNSANILSAVHQARTLGIGIITMLGGSGGQLKDLGDVEFIVDSHLTPRIQEVHQFIGHVICHEVERIFCA
jgi:D-sedoheptulose 7-phosphate isomerase